MFTALTTIRTVSFASILIRIAMAIVLGGLVGIERGMKKRPAGLRTYILVCLGSCVVMTLNQYAYQVFAGDVDPVRMAAQVISGIGFLGAGTIIVTTRNQIKGLTTAAGLWAAACMGLAIGLGFYELAVASGLAIFIVLTVLHELDSKIHKNTRIVELYVELKDEIPIGRFVRSARESDLEISNIQMESDASLNEKSVAFIVTIKGKRPRGHEDILKAVRNLDGVSYLEEL